MSQFNFQVESFEFESELDSEVNRNSRDYIQWVQQSLNQIMGLRLTVDGIIGAQTRSAIRSFQQRQGLVADGIVGEKTEAAIKAALGGPTPGGGAAACVGIRQPAEVLDGFAFNREQMPSTHQPTIVRIANCILASHNTAQPIRSVLIAGHTDPVGGEIYNLDLAYRRAEDVERRLRAALENIKRGSASLVTLEVDACGEAQPISGDNARNRRVEIFVPVKQRPPSKCLPYIARIRLHVKILQDPAIPPATMIRAMQQVYGPAGFLVEHVSTERLDLPDLNVLDVGDCSDAVTAEQRQLFNNRTNAGGNDIVVYFVQATDPPFAGCAAHPPGQPGAVIVQDASEWVLGHEVGHVLGLNHFTDRDRLMHPVDEFTNPPPDLVPCEIRTIDASPLSVDC
jgi:outer membrane protein OmpA-like peptidoglycan-associated protein